MYAFVLSTFFVAAVQILKMLKLKCRYWKGKDLTIGNTI